MVLLFESQTSEGSFFLVFYIQSLVRGIAAVLDGVCCYGYYYLRAFDIILGNADW